MSFRRRLLLTSCLGMAVLGPPPTHGAELMADPAGGSHLSVDIDVIAKKLDVARQQIQPSLGASSYHFSPEALQTIPQGENAPLNQVLLQAPSVAQDSF